VSHIKRSQSVAHQVELGNIGGIRIRIGGMMAGSGG
jgi:hypothetical protein